MRIPPQAHPDLSQLGDGIPVVPFPAPYPSQYKQKKADNLSANKPAVPFIANT
jgi:hypothetical protein